MPLEGVGAGSCYCCLRVSMRMGAATCVQRVADGWKALKMSDGGLEVTVEEGVGMFQPASPS